MKTSSDLGNQRRTLPTQCRGVTLAELLVSMTVMSILASGIASAVLISNHAIPGGESASDVALRCINTLDRIAGELRYTTSVTDASAERVAFTVDDRNHGDPGPETIRYEWSGTSGDTMTRQYNGGTVVPILEDVHGFELAYDEDPIGQGESLTTLVIVNIKVQVGDGDNKFRVETTVQTLNRPEVSGP